MVNSLNNFKISFKRNPISMIVRILIVAAAFLTIGALVMIIGYIMIKGIVYLKPSLFSIKYTSDNVSMLPAIVNTITMTFISLIISVPLGICAAVYMIEYGKKNSIIVKIISLTTQTLAGIPSIIYGLFGLLFFVTQLKMNMSILAGALTLSIMVLPTIMSTTQEALMSVPDSFREGSYALGAGKVRTIFSIVLPAAIPGIMSGVILAIGRMVGETAALMYTAGTVPELATSIMSSGRTLALHMYSLSREGLHVNEAYATAVVLLVLVMIINGVSELIAGAILRKRGEKA